MSETNENSVLETETEETSGAEKTYTQAELDAMVQKIADQRVSQALKTAEKKNAAKVKEAERLAAMNESQRYEYQLQQREQAIAQKEQELAMAENRAVASGILADAGLSAKLVGLVVSDNADVMNENIKLLEKEFKASVKAKVERRLSTSTHKKNLPPDQAITKESFSKMKLSEQAELFRTNPELYNSLVRK
jgi:hypothetical protein